MIYRQFYSWADTNTLLTMYCSAHAFDLTWNVLAKSGFLNKGLQSLEAIQKFAYKS